MNIKAMLAGTIALALTSVCTAQAATFVATGTSSDGNLDAQAVITTGAGSLTVVLSDLLANPTSAGQEVSGIEIFLANSPTSVTLNSASGDLIDINAVKKSANTVTDLGVGAPSHWGATVSGGAIFLATAGTGSKMGKPTDLIIDGGGDYSNANPSITGRDPQIKGAGAFVLDLVGDADPVISSVVFEFGTSPDHSLDGTCSLNCGGPSPPGVPEPASWALMILGFGGAGAMLRRRRMAFA
jgi:hypothetical protein